MPVFGVLGHTDHGKSTFLEKLTGVNPMHLPEERKRGLTIQLGFAFWAPEGEGARAVTFIDVPGHERYLRNMLRGILGMDAALLMVAADDGPMPGTYEHLRASLYAGIKRCAVIITKADLVPPERVEEVRAQLAEFLSGTLWADAPVFAFAAPNPESLPEIKAALAEIVKDTGEADDAPFAYYFIDRVFTAKGEGLITTGTLRGKPVRVGDALRLLPGAREVRVRKAVQDNTETEIVQPHSRVALNITGVKRDQVSPGELLADTSLKPGSGSFAAVLALPPERWREQKPDWKRLEKQRENLNLIVGSAVLQVKDLIVEQLDGAGALAFFRVAEKLPQPPGIRCIVYETGATTISCGGRVIASPEFSWGRRRALRKALSSVAEILRDARIGASDALRDETAAIAGAALELKLNGSCNLALQPELSLLPRELELAARRKIADALPSGDYLRSDDTVVARSVLKAEAEQAKRRLTEIHEQNPMAGAQELSKLTAKGAALRSVSDDEVRRMFTALELEYVDGKVGVPGVGGIPPKWRETYERIKQRFRGDPSQFPTLTVLKREFPTASRLVSELLASGELHHLGAGAVVTGEIYDRWVELIKQHLSRSGQISVQEAKELTRASRKYIIPLLEQLDKRGVTRRVDDVRKPGARFGE